jgi:3-hydroxyisobutyrate dehydrogenase-like beta-hydroxyacid dehydrogenase
MGLPIAQNLMDRGFAVVGYRRSGTGELAALGGMAPLFAQIGAEQAAERPETVTA